MPSLFTKYKILLSSPNDLMEDRSSIDEVINELNLTFGAQQGIIIELIKWETHSAPGASVTHPQKVINSDLGDDYDLFIGLLWKKFGTPTDSAGSGTEEEFRNAYDKFLKSPDSVQILFYFKNSAVPINEVMAMADQLKKIQEFKTDIINKNILYWEYGDTSQLQTFLRIHIQQRITDLQKNQNKPIPKEQDNTAEPLELLDNTNEEEGLIEYHEMIDEYSTEANRSLERIGEAMLWIAEQLHKKTDELEVLNIGNKIGNNPLGMNIYKDFFKRTASVMDNFAKRLEPDIEIFFDNFERTIDTLSRLMNLVKNDLTIDNDEIAESDKILEELITGISDSLEGMVGFSQSVIELPRMSKDISRAKANVISKLDALNNNLKVSLSIAQELRKSINNQLID